ncbi:MAG: hypothetical protein M3Z25_22440 [Actinomycetota bacterium]|nr:hypothetical protein [Pseudonocardiales bacterium]MDQ2710206.1 hypothetical protein [Actinomycetota bacterium]
MSAAERPKVVYGVRVSNFRDGPGVVEAVFSTEAAACDYALLRSAERHHNSGSVTRWELDRPDVRDWLVVYRDGRQQHRNTRLDGR